METGLILKAEIREQTGSSAAAKTRQQGLIPAVVYGHKKEPVTIALNEHDFVEGLHHGHRLFDIQTGNETQKVIVKDLQYDYLGKNIIHADLIRVDVTETVQVEVPLELKGTAKGAEEDGIITQHLNALEVGCKVTNIPEVIIVSVKQMEIGDTYHASDIELPEGVELESDPEMLVVSCSQVAEEQEPEEGEEETPAAPEVIGKGPEDEQGEEGEQEKPEA